MDSLHPVERSLYAPILQLLEDMDFIVAQELKNEKNYYDLLIKYEKNSYILEVKIDHKDDSKTLIDGIIQVYNYSIQYNTPNMIVISYPSFTSNKIDILQEVKERALNIHVESVILTENWHSYESKMNVEEIFSTLKNKIDQQIVATVRVETASSIIQQSVKALSKLLNKHYKNEKSLDEIKNHLTKDYGLFITLTNPKIGKSKIRNQTIDLLAYILTNQILFYFFYSKQSGSVKGIKKVPEIEKIKYLGELNNYFDRIRAIDYRPIYDIEVVSRIPSNADITQEINKLIECLIPLKLSEMKHDVYGRLIGNALPKETREILASYYTKTASADLLASLTIDKYDDTVWDLACGSGTLLVSSYERKIRLYQNIKDISPTQKDILHKKFIENDLTGTDIMPFACHLSGLNLSAKNIRAPTNFIRIAVMNSLSIESLESPISIKESYGDISDEIRRLRLSAKTLYDFVPHKVEIISEPKTFLLNKVNCVVVNPPFTSIRQLPPMYKDEFIKKSTSNICGRRINLWGHFLVLTDKVLKVGGKIGAIIPISLLHGKDTLKLRKFYLTSYSIEYIIKSLVGKPFSEDSEFTDIIFIAKKGIPDSDHKVKIICLKEDLTEWSSTEIDNLVRNIKSELNESNNKKEYLYYEVLQKELFDNVDNLMKYVFTNEIDFKNQSEKIYKILEKSNFTIKMDGGLIRDGHQLRPKGVVDRSVFTRDRISDKDVKFLLTFKPTDDTKDNLTYYNKKAATTSIISKREVEKTLRTLVGINVYDITGKHDYVLKEKLNITDKGKLFIQNRLWLKSNNLFSMAVYTEDKYCPLNLLMLYKGDEFSSKALTLYFNSIYYLIQFLMFTKQSTRGYLEIKQLDLKNMYIPDFDKIGEESKKLIGEYFNNIRSCNNKCILEQLKSSEKSRIELDIFMASILQLNVSKSELEQLYSLIYSHVTNMP